MIPQAALSRMYTLPHTIAIFWLLCGGHTLGHLKTPRYVANPNMASTHVIHNGTNMAKPLVL